MSMSRKELTFASGNDTCAAWLPSRFTVLGWFVSLRTIRLPSRGLQLRPRAKPRKVSSASIQVSIISTSTMDRPHEAVVADEIEFLHRHLLGRSLCGTTKAASELSRVYLPPR